MRGIAAMAIALHWREYILDPPSPGATMLLHLLLYLPLALPTDVGAGAPRPSSAHAALDTVLPNDNRTAGGAMRDGVLTLRLEARLARWRPSLHVDTMATVQTFAEVGGVPRIPGPLLRASSGVDVVVSVRNTLDSVLVVYGLRAGTTARPADDTIAVRPGETRELRFTTAQPGTFLYWGTTTGSPIGDRPWRDSQLVGAIVVDPRGVAPDTSERIFVITVLDLFKADTVHNRKGEDIWERAINGIGWPYNERLAYAVGDTVRWRWLNGSYLPHPMHLHGFHFRVTSKGTGARDTLYAPAERRLAVTEFMTAGSSFTMEWVPTRAGSWLMHCHMIPHIIPFPDRADSVRGHDAHDVEKHPMAAMQGLLLGVTVRDTTSSAVVDAPPITRRVRVFAQQGYAARGTVARRGYVIQAGAPPRRDSVPRVSPPLMLRQGERTAVTVINRLQEHTTVHWHGMELESVYDGVSGWSRTGRSIAPLVAPGDSFTAVMTPPRAGTYIYHTHMDEGPQLTSGLYGPMIVLAPDERYDPSTNLVTVIAQTVRNGKVVFGINGEATPSPRVLRAGTTYRFRIINIGFAEPARVTLLQDTTRLTWTPVAKDGADLTTRQPVPARLAAIGTGETYDFEWTPARPMRARLEVVLPPMPGGTRLQQQFIVR